MKEATNRIKIEGHTFGRLTVIEPVRGITEAIQYRCVCSCGKELIIRGQSIRTGNSQSCGCLGRERLLAASLRHGKSKTKIHNIWLGMLQRCENKNSKFYADYGGRGIDVCEGWHIFENFYRDMGDPPEGMTLDRKKNDLGYSKDNCHWVTRQDQANNRRSNKFITFEGKTLTYAQWERELGLNRGVIWQRVNAGLPIEKILKS